MENTRLSKHFTLAEFLNADKYPDNKPTMQHVANMAPTNSSPPPAGSTFPGLPSPHLVIMSD